MTRETMMAIQQGVAENLRENLTFFKATNRLEDANPESITFNYQTDSFYFNDDEINFDLFEGDRPRPLVEYYKGSDVVVGIQIERKFKRFVSEVSDHTIKSKAREVIAKYMAVETNQYVASWMIDCKLSKLFMEDKITWDDYVSGILSNC